VNERERRIIALLQGLVEALDKAVAEARELMVLLAEQAKAGR
jgi:hypothetical protein